ncbi:MAG: preprotein translocase subunit SecG [Anaerofustis sp.]
MQIALSVLVFVSSVVLIASVLLQEGKSAGMSGAVAGGAESLFGKSRAKGLQAFLQRTTIVSGIIFMIAIFLFSALYS